MVKKMVKHDAEHIELPSFAPYEQKVTTFNESIKKNSSININYPINQLNTIYPHQEFNS